MNKSPRILEFEKLVNNKFEIYNSLFLNLPYNRVNNVGILIPLLFQFGSKQLSLGKEPEEILDIFFEKYAELHTEKEKIDFMFRVIQYVERQVVLFDSVEDAAFNKLRKLTSDFYLKDFFQGLSTAEQKEQFAEKLSTFSARIVFTAHPTQFYSAFVLDIIERLRGLINKNKFSEIDETLQQLGLTSLINSKKPTPLDEAQNIIYYLRNVYYQGVGDLYSSIKNSMGNADFHNTDLVKLGFWPGGDRDGNPFVTAEITSKVADELRMTLMKCYYNDVKQLEKKLSFKKIEFILGNLKDELYTAMFDNQKIFFFENILNPLLDIQEILKSDYNNLYSKDLQSLIDKVKIFKTHFATLDIRQDHSIHIKTIEAILTQNGKIKESLDELSEEQLLDIILNEDFELDPHDFEDELVKDTILNVKQLDSIQQKNGEEGCNRYIISNSENIFSVMFVYALFKWSGYKHPLNFDIIPLFETLKGLNNSENCLQKLFNIPEYKKHLAQRKNKQTIMLGFSDGTKDAGYLKANWSIFETKETLSKVCQNNDIKAIFFDGRGGPPARGGGKTHQFYAAQSQQIANHEIQLTIQGQTITSMYGTKDQFMHNCEQMLTAGLSRNLNKNANDISEEKRTLLHQMADLSFAKYDSLKQHPQFIDYLEQKSPLKYYANANIGSRPGKRGNKAKLTLSDLRAISFVGAWSQLKQNVPGYFGIGSALNELANQGKLEDLKTLFKEVKLFRALILNAMMSLCKTNFDLTQYMAKDKEFGDFWRILKDEFELSKKMVLEITDYEILMEEEEVSRESINIREKIVLPLLLIQQYALQKKNQPSEYFENYEKLITRSLYGNINASRNSV
jgi:phosphoenolpyruvate carboxylase